MASHLKKVRFLFFFFACFSRELFSSSAIKYAPSFEGQSVSFVGFSRDGKTMAVLGKNLSFFICFVDVPSGKEKYTPITGVNYYFNADFRLSPKGQFFAFRTCVTLAPKLLLWEKDKWLHIADFSDEKYRISPFSFNSTGNLMLCERNRRNNKITGKITYIVKKRQQKKIRIPFSHGINQVPLVWAADSNILLSYCIVDRMDRKNDTWIYRTDDYRIYTLCIQIPGLIEENFTSFSASGRFVLFGRRESSCAFRHIGMYDLESVTPINLAKNKLEKYLSYKHPVIGVAPGIEEQEVILCFKVGSKKHIFVLWDALREQEISLRFLFKTKECAHFNLFSIWGVPYFSAVFHSKIVMFAYCPIKEKDLTGNTQLFFDTLHSILGQRAYISEWPSDFTLFIFRFLFGYYCLKLLYIKPVVMPILGHKKGD